MSFILSSVGSNLAKNKFIYLHVTRVHISANFYISSDCRGARGKSTCGWYREKFNQNSSVASFRAITIFQIGGPRVIRRLILRQLRHRNSLYEMELVSSVVLPALTMKYIRVILRILTWRRSAFSTSYVSKSRWRTPYDGSWMWIFCAVWVTISLMFLDSEDYLYDPFISRDVRRRSWSQWEVGLVTSMMIE